MATRQLPPQFRFENEALEQDASALLVLLVLGLVLSNVFLLALLAGP